MNFDARKSEIRGPAALAMIPWNKDFSPDLGALEENIHFMIDGGVVTGRGFVISPSGTGELVMINKTEHQQVVEASVKAVDGRMPLVAGIASCNVFDAIEMAKNAFDAGAGHIMLCPPFYFRLDDESFFSWIKTVADAVPEVAIMLYDQPWRGHLSTNLTFPLLQRVSEEVPQVVSMKYGSPSTYMPMITAVPAYKDRFAFIDNSLGYTSTVGHIHGSTSFISGPASWWPEFELKYWDLLEAGEYAEADRWHARLAPYMNFFVGEEFTPGEEHGYYFASGDPHAYYFGASIMKASLEFVGLTGGSPRPPFTALDEAVKKHLFRIMEEIPFDGRRV